MILMARTTGSPACRPGRKLVRFQLMTSREAILWRWLQSFRSRGSSFEHQIQDRLRNNRRYRVKVINRLAKSGVRGPSMETAEKSYADPERTLEKSAGPAELMALLGLVVLADVTIYR